MPKVAIIGTRGYPSFYGGFETAVRKLAPYLADQGWDVTVYSRTPRGPSSGADRRVRSVITRGIETKSLSTLSYGFTSAVHAAREKPDVALVMNVANGFWLPILKARGVPTLVNVDGIEWDREKWGKVAKGVFKSGARFTAKWADQLVFDAHEIGRRWTHEFDRDGVFIPYGGDAPSSSLPVVTGLERRGYILVVARFVPENSIPQFFDAVELLPSNLRVIIVGSSGYGGELDERAEKLSQTRPGVEWLGHVSDDQKLLSLWQNAGVYFHGHSVGGTNPALVQAMAAGAPTLARDTPYNREVLGDEATYTSPNAAEIASKLVRLLNDPDEMEANSMRGQRRAEAIYTWERVCSSYERSLRELIA